MYYTYGQRQGLGIGGVKNRPEVPWYVAGKDLENNVLIAVQGHNHPMLLSQKLEAHKLHWVKGHPPAQTFNCKAKIRYRQPDQACQIHIDDNDYLYATFEHAQRAVTPGQSIVLYDEDVCLGGGIITKAWH
jgi:tRNA-specific 2-thiouridylase